MIILHSQHDAKSREFIALPESAGHTILPYPDCLAQYPVISAFPSVVVEVPAYYQVPILSDDGVEIAAGCNVPAHTEIFDARAGDWQEVLDYVDFIAKRAADNPPREEE